MSDESALAKARHGMSVLWDEITCFRMLAAELLKEMENIMSVHDDTKAILGECVSLFDKIKGAKASSDASSDAAIADLKDQASSLRDDMKAFADRLNVTLNGSSDASSDASSDGQSSVLGGVAG